MWLVRLMYRLVAPVVPLGLRVELGLEVVVGDERPAVVPIVLHEAEVDRHLAHRAGWGRAGTRGTGAPPSHLFRTHPCGDPAHCQMGSAQVGRQTHQPLDTTITDIHPPADTTCTEIH